VRSRVACQPLVDFVRYEQDIDRVGRLPGYETRVVAILPVKRITIQVIRKNHHIPCENYFGTYSGSVKESNTDIWDVIVVGGGPSGMIAAARAGQRGLRVLLLEKNTRLGKKLSITGGGRCNVTNNKPDVRTMLEKYKDAGKFLFSTFSQHGVSQSIEWFTNRSVPLHEENEGRLFPDTNSAETICATLVSELQKHNVTVQLNASVSAIMYDSVQAEFTIRLANKEELHSRKCIVATGGTSRPETGSTGEGFEWLEKLGHTINQNSFGLVPVALKEAWVARVSGVVLPEVKITVYADDVKQRSELGKILFTHTGISGPTILNMSKSIGELLEYSEVTLFVDVFPKLDEGTLRNYLNEALAVASNKKLLNILTGVMPRAFVKIVLEQLQIDGETPGHSVRTEDRAKLIAFLKRVPLTVTGLLGANKAVISGGGVKLEEIDFKTMSSRIIPGLHLVGDVLDIDRPSGGYSLQLCWSTGWVAGSCV